jgi:hypothetical protein
MVVTSNSGGAVAVAVSVAGTPDCGDAGATVKSTPVGAACAGDAPSAISAVDAIRATA